MSSDTLQDIFVRPLKSADVDAIHGLHSALLPLRYPLSFFIQLLIKPDTLCLVAYAPARTSPVAFVSAAVKPTPSIIASKLSCAAPNSSPIAQRHVQILTLGVLPEFRHKGIARSLIHAVVSRLSGSVVKGVGVVGLDDVLVSAQVSSSNGGAHCFYERLGLMPILKVRDVYRGVSYGSRDAQFVVGYISPSITAV
ncbi:hypothetical protein ONZ45_g4836 [Pleurotus djamor]|nr:hypothetical protein ONZ45_g4836 [Pleurotus djamor]